ncbi:MAG: LysM peptidoglycan-binding domain-containing protein [Chloroflexi bacterium]|nr:LysM peptidoglycan-binding domain-containing protein [Chloroflexota bacterium]
MNFHIKIRAWALTAVCVLILSSTLVMAQQPPAGGTIHVVQRGETLFRIAQSYGLTTDVLARVNGILNPSNILVGQRLIIPGPDFIPETETPETYIVQFADTLASISAAFGVNLETLVALNSLANPDSIYVGQVLRLSGEIPQTDAPAEGAPDSPEPPREQVIHRVQRGETLFRSPRSTTSICRPFKRRTAFKTRRGSSRGKT